MQDSELKKLLLETCPVLPGQEDRAWTALREQIYGRRERSAWHWLFFPTWRGMTVGAVVVLIGGIGGYMVAGMQSMVLATADSQSPGIYATAFYSKPAKAQVVWLNGMAPATDKPTYLDPTSAIPANSDATKPGGDPNSL